MTAQSAYLNNRSRELREVAPELSSQLPAGQDVWHAAQAVRRLADLPAADLRDDIDTLTRMRNMLDAHIRRAIACGETANG